MADVDNARYEQESLSEDNLSILWQENLNRLSMGPPEYPLLGESLLATTGDLQMNRSSLSRPPPWRMNEHATYKDNDPLPFNSVKLLAKGSVGVVDAIDYCDSYGPRRSCARKVVMLGFDGYPFLSQIRNEVDVTKRARHVHVVSILATYEQLSASGRVRSFGIIMDPVADGDLEGFLVENPVLTDILQRDLKRWCVCLINTLDHIHEQRVRHGDIKPRNILVLRGQIYFTDFGIARDFSGRDTTETQTPRQKTKVLTL
ncbi:hypothetical protein FGG08_001123 [Glutinoglossum americanum]|uniref:Protein kinase domain-containing protein n=1 Tax=Glutinoglossum americanum TaxID=1670608 RepID=A0A9P8I2L4_9PEZI|nr:hypothetical protein FGG08_001123 [Glutinoglossum americanum]